ncbi:unnamed protein product [Cylicocyclus nassatus]|uniref:Uncharacterized protein n=1 Tax=Cylicocyclus nassatus TaxID=53992 RepID=A0AA36GK26_CYLNA|nr:unnamed protein product [Cylicocyclus nassatus]
MRFLSSSPLRHRQWTLRLDKDKAGVRDKRSARHTYGSEHKRHRMDARCLSLPRNSRHGCTKDSLRSTDLEPSYGCSECGLKGLVQGRQRIWLPYPDEITSLRSPESFAQDAQNYGQIGILQMTPVMRVMLRCAFSSNSLHICPKGVTRDRLRDMFNAASRFPDLRLNDHNTELLKT